MATKSEDDFWNTSSSNPFNFDDDEDNDQQQFTDFVFKSVSEKGSVLPIHSIISKGCLDLVLDDIKSTIECVVPPVQEVIKNMMNGHKCSLEVYKKFSDKMFLLDSALAGMDGSTILNIIMFLKATLKPNIFYHQLSKRKLAVKHYANQLIVSNQYQELVDLYIATGNSSNLKQVYYLFGRDIKDKDVLYKRLEQFFVEHLQTRNKYDEMEISENMQLIQWQIERHQDANTVIDQLAALCKTEWEKNRDANEAILAFKRRIRIDEFAFEWTTMNVLASMQLWPQMTALFVKPNWLTKKNVLKAVMSPELFVYGISRHDPPKDVLEQYLVYISDSHKSLYLAQKLNCHKFIIQYYVQQRDRSALVSYKERISPHSDDYFLIESALQSNDKKWKN